MNKPFSPFLIKLRFTAAQTELAVAVGELKRLENLNGEMAAAMVNELTTCRQSLIAAEKLIHEKAWLAGTESRNP